jgi:hypothetical protein
MIQPDDIVIEGGVGVDVVQRFNEAFASGLARKLYRKFPEKAIELGITIQDLNAEADAAFVAALKEDIERGVNFYVTPGLSGYFR